MPDELVLILVASVIPASVARLWWLWWQSGCHGRLPAGRPQQSSGAG